MPQSNTKTNRVSLKAGQLILDALWEHCGTDSDNAEADFYRLNPTVDSMHIPKDGDYILPVIETTDKATGGDEGLLVWGL